MKKFCYVFAILIVLPFFAVGCQLKKGDLNSYHISATYDDQSQTLSCRQTTTYHNTSENALQEVCFFLYPNSFEEGQKTVSASYLEKAYPNGESYGNITFNDITISGEKCEYSVTEKHNILNVKLFEKIFPGENVCIYFEYVVCLANIDHRLGYNAHSTNFGGFFPIACVYENGFVENDFSSNGDPFYSEVSNFEVELNFPKEYVLASTGNQEKTDSGAICVAENVRDFCFVLSKEFSVLTENIGGIDVNYFFYDDEESHKHLQTSIKALTTFEKLFGKYPYGQLSVVETAFCFGGMEYPNLVFISDSVDRDVTYDYVIAHEIAHQWWYGLVGNNQFSQSWVDESLTEYSTLLFFEENADYGINYSTSIDNAIETYKNFVKIYSDILGEVDQSMNRNLKQFATEPEYVNCIYTKGVIMFDSIRQSLGQKKFLKCLQAYFETYKHQIASGQSLIDVFSKTSKRNMQKYFDSWLTGQTVIN